MLFAVHRIGYRRLRGAACVWLVLVAICWADSCRAAVFERDWQAPDDGLLTFDDVDNREWLDLSVSRFDQFPEPRLENAIAELAPGGLFEGFTWAKRNDVRRLAESAGIDTSTSNFAINGSPTIELIRLVGPTFENMHFLRSIALIDEPQVTYPFIAYDGAAFLVNYGGLAGLASPLNDDELVMANALLLYRTVPEPSTSLLILLEIAFLILHRRQAPAE
jgi:hypothetical protein